VSICIFLFGNISIDIDEDAIDYFSKYTEASATHRIRCIMSKK
jgi:hypothetical protein